MMDKPCKGCKEYTAHRYWDHMDNRKKRFFKPMIGNFKKEVTIPGKFVCRVGKISELVKLETPDGNTYNVHVAKELNNLVLRSGWSKFASVYEIEEGDLLRFKYNGDSHFKVEIYDPSACEKESSCVVMNCNPVSLPRDDPMFSPEGERLAKCHNGSCSDSRKTSKMNSARSAPPKPTKREAPSSEGFQDDLNSGDLRTSTRSRYFLAAGCNLPDAHKAEVDNIEHNIRPEIPLYVKTMSSSSLVDGFLAICKDYAIEYLPLEDKIITLCHASHSKTWSAHFKINADGTYHLSAGWSGFVQDNELQIGDTCVFEVLSQKRFTMAVHLLKASCHHPPGFAPSAKILRPEDKVMLSRFTTLKGLLKTKVYEKVEAIKSEIHIFVSIMTKTNVSRNNCILAFSLDYAKDYLPGEDHIIRLHRPGKNAPWETSFKFFKQRRWLVTGWKQFVIDNKLKLDDVCLFERIENKKKLRMMVHIIQKEEYC